MIHYIICIYILHTLSSLYHFFILFHLLYRSLDHFNILYRSSPSLVSTLQFLLLCQLLSHFHFLFLCITTFKCSNNLCPTVFRYISFVVSMLVPQHMLYPGLSHFYLGTNAWPISIFVSTLQHFYYLHHWLFHFNLCMDAPATFISCIMASTFNII